MAIDEEFLQDFTLDVLAKFYKGHLKPELKEIKSSLSKLDEGIRNNGKAIQDLKNDFDGLKEEFSGTPSSREFTALKTKVDRFHPTS